LRHFFFFPKVLGRCHPRQVYDSFSTPPGTQLEPAAMAEGGHAPAFAANDDNGLESTGGAVLHAPAAAASASAVPTSSSGVSGRGSGGRSDPLVSRRCHWHSRAHPEDVPNECLLDHWLASNGAPFVEAMVPTCIRKKPTAASEPCPAISFNRSRKADTRNC
jgi:hypothetical protein